MLSENQTDLLSKAVQSLATMAFTLTVTKEASK
jgi:hypothetical protein